MKMINQPQPASTRLIFNAALLSRSGNDAIEML
jgi:hypothetical protein